MRHNKTTQIEILKRSTEAADLPRLERAEDENQSPSSRFNFCSEEFNRIDELDDNIGNYREFESLDGVVTSDMRYHQERRKKKRATPQTERIREEEGTEQGSIEQGAEGGIPQPLTIVSTGRLLIIDDDVSRAVNCAHYLKQLGMICTLCATEKAIREAGQSAPDACAVLGADSVAVDGCFGFFVGKVANESGGHLDRFGPDGQSVGVFDLVLDLKATPSFAGKQLPQGYFAPGQDPELIDDALAALAEMRGKFQKQQLVVIKKNRCINRLSRFRDCQRCMDICPFGAIALASKDRGIEIDHYRCQGCGWCGPVCPTDAIELQYPSQKELLSEVVGLMSAMTSPDLQAPDLYLHGPGVDVDRLRGMAGQNAAHTLLLEVEETGRVGLEMLLLCLACGVASVTVVFDETLPVELRQILERQVQFGKEILLGLRIPVEKIQLQPYSPDQGDSGVEGVMQSVLKPPPPQRSTSSAVFSLDADRRSLVRQVVEFLQGQYGAGKKPIALSADAPFGAIAIDGSCSFCMACVSICPSGALRTDGDIPRITMVESRCHQCSLCKAACPERAIELLPRLNLDCRVAEAPAILREEEPFRCVECGKPFASTKMVSRMEEKLRGHWMYNTTRQVRRLQMCRSCRTHDALVAGDFQI